MTVPGPTSPYRRPAPVPDFAHRSIEALIQAGARRYDLKPLDDDSVVQLCVDVLGGAPDTRLLATARRAEGNPFLLAELLSALVDSEQVRVTDGRAVLLGDALTDDFATAVGHKLSDLSEESRRLLEAASVFGRPFTVHEVAGLVGPSPIETTVISPLPASEVMNTSTASRIIWSAGDAAWLSSISSATVNGSVAAPAFSTSRAVPSSRTRKSSAARPGAGSPLESTTVT